MSDKSGFDLVMAWWRSAVGQVCTRSALDPDIQLAHEYLQYIPSFELQVVHPRRRGDT